VEQFLDARDHNPRLAVLKPSTEHLPGRLAGSMLVRRDAFHRAGPFDPRLRIGESIDW
jgi:hypothetical protein